MKIFDCGHISYKIIYVGHDMVRGEPIAYVNFMVQESPILDTIKRPETCTKLLLFTPTFSMFFNQHGPTIIQCPVCKREQIICLTKDQI